LKKGKRYGSQDDHRHRVAADRPARNPSVPGIYAAGDVQARSMLSPMAVVEARVAAENALGVTVKMDYTCAP